MKTTLIAALLLMSANSFANFSSDLIGSDSSSQDKDFSKGNQERLHAGTNEIILTFDDGPTPGVTEKVLDVLKEHNVKATFFMIAEKAQAHPELVKRVLDEGHIVGNHSLTHKALNQHNVTFLNWKKLVRTEVLGAHAILGPYMANGEHFYYRAPEGAWEGKFADLLNQDPIGQQYIGPILWDIGGEFKVSPNGQITEAADWACWSKKVSVDDCLSGYLYEARTKKGGVVLMHDLLTRSPELLAKFLPALEKNGFQFRTLDDVNWAARKK